MAASSMKDELRDMIARGAGVVSGAGTGRPPVRGHRDRPAIGGRWRIRGRYEHGNLCIHRANADGRGRQGRAGRRHAGRRRGRAASRTGARDPHHARRRQRPTRRRRRAAGQGGGGEEPGDLHPPVLGHDRRRPAAGAVPRDPRQPGRGQELRPGHPADAGRRRVAARRWPTRCASTRTRSTRCSSTWWPPAKRAASSTRS